MPAEESTIPRMEPAVDELPPGFDVATDSGESAPRNPADGFSHSQGVRAKDDDTADRPPPESDRHLGSDLFGAAVESLAESLRPSRQNRWIAPGSLWLLVTVGGVALLVSLATGNGPWGSGVGLGCLAMLGFYWRAVSRRDQSDLNRLLDAVRDQFRENQRRWASLHAEATQNTSVLAQMPEGIVVVGRNQEVLVLNPAACSFLGLRDGDQVRGKRLGDWIRLPELIEAIDRLAKDGRGSEFRLEVNAANRIRPLRFVVGQADTGVEKNVLVTIHDETSIRRIDEMRRQFVSNVSHELKTPLAAIKGYAETVELAIEDDPEAATRFMGQIKGQCLRLEQLVQDMMQLARAQEGRGRLQLMSLSLEEIVSESFRSKSPIAEANEITLSLREFDDVIVVADAEAMLTITNNLIGNAIRYTPSGGQVEVFFGVMREKGFGCLRVRDNGIGIAAEDQSRVFERFYRVAKNRESHAGSTGLGLSIVKNLTLAQGGQVRLSSKPGQGSLFEIRLPLDDTSASFRRSASS
ncbi:MAG: ATP-binding protein [Planctomycetota bacterium]